MNLTDVAKLSEESAREYLEKIRWPNGARCPHCGSDTVTKLQGEKCRPGLYKCKAKGCRKQFTVTVGTIFADSHLTCKQWVLAFHLMCSSKKGISAHQLHRELGCTYKSAWHLAHRIRYAMKKQPLAGMLKDRVEVDETYVGGKPRKGNAPSLRGRGTKKSPVVVLVERGGSAVVKKVKNVSARELKKAIREVVHKDARINTDELTSYRGIGDEFAGGHGTVKHSAGEYKNGEDHTNSAEAFFALLKRGVHGTFHHVSKKHLQRYCDEFGFRWNHRKTTDGERTDAAIQGAEGKRLMYSEPIGGLFEC